MQDVAVCLVNSFSFFWYQVSVTSVGMLLLHCKAAITPAGTCVSFTSVGGSKIKRTVSLTCALKQHAGNACRWR